MGWMRRLSWVACACVLLVGVAGCGPRAGKPEGDTAGTAISRSGAERLPPVKDASGARVVVLGDSLTAGLGLSQVDAYPTGLQQRIDDAGLKFTIVNAGVSGDTSAGGLARLDWALDGDVRVLVVALGGNDALRGLPTEQMAQNISTIIERAQARGITVVLAGMEAPPNFGHDYTVSFHKVFPSLAKKYHVALVPFLLQGVGGVASLNQADGIHPTAPERSPTPSGPC
jgi:acyl-CoA thioesterase I